MNLALSLDGTPILDDIESAEIVWDWAAPHAEIEIQSRDAALWPTADPATGRGTARLVADFGGGNTWSFLLESREGEPDEFTIRGRSLSALMTADYAAPVVAMWRNVSTWAGLIQAHAPGYSVAWNVPDYTVPGVYVWGGFPMAGIKALAEMFGAVVRPLPAGGVSVESAYPVRPSQLATATADHSLTDADHIIEIEAGKALGDNYDSVVIRSESPDDEPTIEQGEGEAVAGVSPALLYVYWPDGDQSPAPSIFTTGTAATLVTNEDHTETETVVFQDGAASVRYPIRAIISQSWQGVAGGTMEFAEGSKNLRILEREPRVGDIEYRTRRAVYQVSAGSETAVFALARPGADSGHRLHISGADFSAPADEIVERWLTDLNGKKARAQDSLFASWDAEEISLTVPDTAGFFQPGEIADLDSEDVAGNIIIRKCTYRAGSIREDWQLEGFRWLV